MASQSKRSVLSWVPKIGRNIVWLTIIGGLPPHHSPTHPGNHVAFPKTHPLLTAGRLLLCKGCVGVLLAILIGLSAARPSRAEETTITALTNQSCAGTRSATNLLCTANDFTASATFTQPSASALASCRAGEILPLNILATITSQQAQRYDVGIFLGEHGNAPNLNDATATCSLGVFPTSPDPPYYNDDGDTCGDYRKASTSNLTILDVNVKCLPAPGTNYLGIPYVVVFDNQPAGATCSAAKITAGTSSKCTMGIGPEQATVVDLTVNGYVTMTKQTNPGGAADSFAFIAGGSATPIPASFSLTDGEEKTVQIPLNASGGDQTLTISETQLGGWDSNATIVCTDPLGGPAPYVTIDPAKRRLTATLNANQYGAVCTITNTRLQTQLTLVKAASAPTVNPGQVITYTVTAANSDAAAASSVVLEDHLSPFTFLGLNSYGAAQPFELLDSTPASGLALGSPVYSSDHGTSWSYVPTSTGGGAPAGYDAVVTNWRIPLLGTMRAGGSITLRYQVQIK